MTGSNDHKTRLKQDFIAKRGYWSDFWDGLLELNPAFFSAYLDYSSIPWTSGPLSPKTKEFIYIAIDAATTHLYDPGLRVHLKNALKYGATAEEIMELYRLTSSLGAATMLLGGGILAEALDRKTGNATPHHPGISGGDAGLREAFVSAFGFWDADCDAWLRLDPTSFVAAVNAWTDTEKSPLDPKTRSLVLIAVNASVTHMDARALRAHVSQSLDNGATVNEIIEVLQLTSVLGMHTCTLGVPILMEELAGLTTAGNVSS